MVMISIFYFCASSLFNRCIAPLDSTAHASQASGGASHAIQDQTSSITTCERSKAFKVDGCGSSALSSWQGRRPGGCDVLQEEKEKEQQKQEGHHHLQGQAQADFRGGRSEPLRKRASVRLWRGTRLFPVRTVRGRLGAA